jgi:transcriptional regulator of met regulon
MSLTVERLKELETNFTNARLNAKDKQAAEAAELMCEVFGLAIVGRTLLDQVDENSAQLSRAISKQVASKVAL